MFIMFIIIANVFLLHDLLLSDAQKCPAAKTLIVFSMVD